MQSDLPQGYFELISDLTLETLKNNPEDFIDFAEKFFNKVFIDQGDKDFYETPEEIKEDSESLLSSLIDSLSEEDMVAKPKANFRRKSVAAERINIDELDDDEDIYKIIPKTDEQREKLNSVCRQILLFKNLDEEQMENVINAMFEVSPTVGEKIIVQGDEGDNFYIIESGVYKCFIKDDKGGEKLIYTYNGEGYFGELALMYSAVRGATVVADVPGTLWAMDRQTFRVLVVAATNTKKTTYDNFLKTLPIFKEVTASERMNVADALIPKTYTDKEIIIKQGQPGREMFFIESGEVLITKTHNGSEMELVRLTKGQYFGELALLSNKARQASAVAVGSVKCAMLDVKTFERLMGPCMDVMKRNAAQYETQIAELFEKDS